ncbi:sporulation protein YqfC [Anaerosinus gibii]|uniref:Sporulation protein YqfC n=1 Tax=Selenobaculum gibii TaxID=3054208 RepID=A0A9Y2AI18_9FIRM|nr:sporulation protein YqfC [Selenobaculum gbiensis]WIW69795.1 sporulation protein YqfC [Selenobaculum gbiensis]
MRRNNLRKLVKAFEIPEDVMGDLSRLTMLGNKQLLIENHRGIIEYTSTYIRLNLVDGILVIKGTHLALGNLQLEQILVEGKVGEIHYDT